ncbi:MAG TPA: hypothetical protein VI670_15880 [Thermoanaerobaculia bacterium]
MPVTAKLSRKFYERFGDDLTNELVEWFNQVDTTYRSEFRDLFEVNFARFDAKLEQRVAELRAELLAEIGEIDRKVDSKLSAFELKLSAFEARLIRWMFLFWVGTLGTVIALLKL